MGECKVILESTLSGHWLEQCCISAVHLPFIIIIMYIEIKIIYIVGSSKHYANIKQCKLKVLPSRNGNCYDDRKRLFSIGDSEGLVGSQICNTHGLLIQLCSHSSTDNLYNYNSRAKYSV